MFNFKTKKAYSGNNVDALMLAGFESEYWMTYRQAQEMGYQVMKGQKGTKLIKIVEKEVINKETGKKQKKKVPVPFTVFNMEQMQKIEEMEVAA